MNTHKENRSSFHAAVGLSGGLSRKESCLRREIRGARCRHGVVFSLMCIKLHAVSPSSASFSLSHTHRDLGGPSLLPLYLLRRCPPLPLTLPATPTRPQQSHLHPLKFHSYYSDVRTAAVFKGRWWKGREKNSKAKAGRAKCYQERACNPLKMSDNLKDSNS